MTRGLTRRQVIAAAAAPLVAAPRLDPAVLPDVLAWLEDRARDRRPTGALAEDEVFWAEVARAFPVDRSLINLNNGGVSPSPAVVLEALKRHLDYSNQAPAYTMWKVLEPQREGVRAQLARQLGCDAEEVALTRNASESLQALQFGFDLARGDVVLACDQDYPRMLTTFRQRARREGIVLREFPLPHPVDDPAEVVAAYEREMDQHRPKLLLLSHVLFTTGQLQPVREVIAAARRRGIPVIVDGAHAFAHFDYRLHDLDCDYYGTTLHKWLCAPHGTGALFVRRDQIERLWPLMAVEPKLDTDIRKFEEIGTHPAANYLAIAEALQFHQALGPARKAARLSFLREHWLRRLVDAHPDRFVLHTSRKPGLAHALATVQLVGVDSERLCEWLWDRHRIFTVAILHERVSGLRIGPSVYTTLDELDRFCAAMEQVLAQGLK